MCRLYKICKFCNFVYFGFLFIYTYIVYRIAYIVYRIPYIVFRISYIVYRISYFDLFQLILIDFRSFHFWFFFVNIQGLSAGSSARRRRRPSAEVWFVKELRCSELVTRQVASHGRRCDGVPNLNTSKMDPKTAAKGQVDHPCGQPHLLNHTKSLNH